MTYAICIIIGSALAICVMWFLSSGLTLENEWKEEMRYNKKKK